MNEIQKALKLVLDLNNKQFETFGEIDTFFELWTDGGCYIIKFRDISLFNSEFDDIDDDNGNDIPIIETIKKNLRMRIDELENIIEEIIWKRF